MFKEVWTLLWTTPQWKLEQLHLLSLCSFCINHYLLVVDQVMDINTFCSQIMIVLLLRVLVFELIHMYEWGQSFIYDLWIILTSIILFTICIISQQLIVQSLLWDFHLWVITVLSQWLITQYEIFSLMQVALFEWKELPIALQSQWETLGLKTQQH